MMVNERGLALIAEFEGFRPTPYNDVVGHCTVGYGELLHLGNCTPEELARPPITEEEGYAFLADKVVPYAEAVIDQASADLNENQLDALTSLCYNVGPGGIANVMRAHNTGGDVCGELRKIIHGTNGVVYPGLVRRREAECALYNTPMPEEETDMKPVFVWDFERQRAYLIGPFGAVYVPFPEDATALEALYGKPVAALHSATVDAFNGVVK